MTEEEAKIKPCIGPRPELTGVAIEGERQGKVTMWACRASACQAWRWEWVESEEPGVLVRSETQGYCGLAGTP